MPDAFRPEHSIWREEQSMTRTIQKNINRGYSLGIAFGIIIVALMLVSYAAAAHPAGNESYHGKGAATNEVLVKFRASSTPGAISKAKIGENVDEAESIGSAGVMRFHSKNKNVTTLISDLSAQADVEYAEPDYIVHAALTPNDPYFGLGYLWGLNEISAPSAWSISTGSTANVVAVIDTGIDYTHPDLAANIWSAPTAYTVTIAGSKITCPAGSHGFNAITKTCDCMDDNSHGTHVSGTIGAVGNNGLGVVGVNWNTKIMGSKFLDASGSGYLSDAINAIDFVIQTKSQLGSSANVRVLSNSWGGGGYSQALMDEINKANAADMLFVAAAGNSASNNDNTPFYPASYSAPNVIAVAATDNNDLLASFSNYGPTTVHLGAPGVNILSTIRKGGYAYYSGTSMATPDVSGAALLILSKCTLDTAKLKTDILNNVDQIPSLNGKTVTGGRLDVNKAICACSAPATPTTTALSALPVSSTYGVSVTFTATVTPSAATGTVTFYDGGSVLGTRTLTGGQGTFTSSALSGGVHSITATYGGDSTFGGSTSSVLPYTVNPAGTSTVLKSTTANSTFGQLVTFTATVLPASATGTVTFSDSNVAFGTANLAGGSASLSSSTLAVGTHTITATYNGNSNYLTSTSSPGLPLTVSQASSTTALTSSVNPSTVGQLVTFTATVSPASATGTVTFSDSNVAFGTANLAGGSASLSSSTLAVGAHSITATYNGDSNVAGSASSSITQTVNSASASDFSLSASPSSQTVTRRSSATYTVSITRTSGFKGSVALSVSGLPSGASGTFSPNPATGTSSRLSIKTARTTPTGRYPLTITGTNGRLNHKTSVTLIVQS
jgi:subtilisin family serine protease